MQIYPYSSYTFQMPYSLPIPLMNTCVIDHIIVSNLMLGSIFDYLYIFIDTDWWEWVSQLALHATMLVIKLSLFYQEEYMLGSSASLSEDVVILLR